MTINLSKLWIRIQQHTATDFQGWFEMPLKIKTACFFIFRSGFQTIISQVICGTNGFDAICKNDAAIFTRLISFTGPFTLDVGRQILPDKSSSDGN